MTARVRFIMQRATAVTARSTLELLGLRWPFSQLSLLTPEEFVRGAEARHLGAGGTRSLSVAAMEELHRCRILVPFYRVDLVRADEARARQVGDSLTLERAGSTIVSELFTGATAGRVADPATEAFEPWPTERRRSLWPCFDSGYLYSHHQFLTLGRAASALDALRPSRPDANSGIKWRLADDDLPGDDDIEGFRTWRSLAIVLTAIDTWYWPVIMQTVHHNLELWRSLRVEFDLTETWKWLGVSADDIVRQADQLRFAGSSDDVLGDFYDIVRRAKPESWTSLRGRALTSMDSRIAAEVLHLSVQQDDDAMAATGVPTSSQWIGERAESLDFALHRLHLSPHPALVLGVEGETELLLVPRVFELLGIRIDPSFIRIENFGGTTKDLSLLARFAAAPQLGRDTGEFVFLDRPVTRFLVATDAEGRYKTVHDRHGQRKLLLDSITTGLPADLKADIVRRGSRFVEIVTWGRYPFEFAHYTDRQLADAMLGIARHTHPGGRAGLVACVHKQRTLDPSPNIEDAWKRSGIKKLQLAEAMWPLLEQKIGRAIASGTKGPPVMRAAVRAYELAVTSYGQSVALRRRATRHTRAKPATP